MERYPGSRKLRNTTVTVSITAYSSAPGKGCPSASVTTLLHQGRVSPVRKLLQLCSWEVFQLCSGAWSITSLFARGKFPREGVMAPLCSRDICHKLWRKCHTTQQTSFKRLIWKEESRKIAALGEKQQQTKLNRVQTLYRISWGVCPFQGGFGSVDFCSLILGQAQGLIGFHAQGLVGFCVQGPQRLVGFCTEELVKFCSLTLGQAQALVQFQALVLGSSQGHGIFSWPRPRV